MTRMQCTSRRPLRRWLAGLMKNVMTNLMVAFLGTAGLVAGASAQTVVAMGGALKFDNHEVWSRIVQEAGGQGAKLVETAQDVLEELAPGSHLPATPAPEAPEPATGPQALLDAMGYDPVSLDALQARSGWPAAELSAALLELELDGLVARLAGQLFQRRHKG